MSPLRQCLAVAALLVAVTVVLTWPLASRLSSAVIDLGDPLLHCWILAWDLHALRQQPLSLFDANIFHPHRRTLAYSDHLLGLVPLAAPASRAGAGPIGAYNVVWLATFPLTGFTMFLLVRHLTGQAAAGVVAGLLYAFSHYRFGQLSQVQLLSHQWLPLMLLGLHRTLASGSRWRDIVLAAAAFALQALSSGYYAFFAAVAGALFVAWAAGPATRPPLARLAWRALVAAAVVALLVGPTYLPYYFVRRDVGLIRALREVQPYSARPTSYLAAPPGNRWLGALTEPFRQPEGQLFPGAVMLALAGAGLIGAPLGAAAAASRSDSRRAASPRWLDVALSAYLTLTLVNAAVLGGFAVSLGPVRVSQRHFEGAVGLIVAALLIRRLVNGRAVPLPGLGWLRSLGWPSPVGYYVGLTLVAVLCSFGPALKVDNTVVARPLYGQLYKRVPGFDGLRVPARFAMLASTGLAVLAGYGAARLTRAPRRRAVGISLAAVLGTLAVLESWSVPLSFVRRALR